MNKAFMGISIRHPFYSKKENILKAINLAKDFDEFLIFVVDFPYRLSLQAFNELSEKEAEELALKEGEELRKFLVNITGKFEQVKISSWKELADDDYCELLDEVKELEKENKEFSKLVEEEFIKSIISKIKGDKRKEQLSKEFIIEEIAMFASLALKGFSTRVSKYSRFKSIDYFLEKKDENLAHIQME